MDQKQALLENISEFLKEAKAAKERKSWNSAATLFFKALAVLTDAHILQQEGFIPSNHTERFRILREKYIKIYRILDKDFPLYQDSYRLKITEPIVKILENDVYEIAKLTNITINSEEV